MNRRKFLAAGGAGLVAPGVAAEPGKTSILDLSYIQMRNSRDEQARTTQEFVEKTVAPALRRAGSGPVGIFSNLIGPDSPRLMVLTSYKSLADMDVVRGRLRGDEELRKAAEAYYGRPGLVYQRIERSLLEGFETVPGIEVAPAGEGRSGRVFELRVYESDNAVTLARKVGMFNQGEIAIFRRLNMRPVFFGTTLVGPRMPNLTYMLAFDSLAAREKAWSAFGADPEWQKMRKLPGLADGEVVSNISNSIFRAMPGSDIR